MIDLTRETVLSVHQAAEKLGVTTKTVYLWASDARGDKPRLETAKVGGKRITTLEALQRFTQQEAGATPAYVPAIETDYEAAIRGLRDLHGINITNKEAVRDGQQNKSSRAG